MGVIRSLFQGLQLVGKKASRGRMASGAVLPDLALWNATARIGGGITPAKISTIIRAADGGDMRQLMDLANECRQRDSHLQCVLATNEEAISGLPWQLVAASSEERAKDRRAREWCEKVLRATPSLSRLLGHLAGGVYFGHAVAETMWAKVDGKLVPTEFKPIAPRRFGFLLSDGSFVYREPSQSADQGLDFKTTHPHKFVTSQPRVTGDIANREGLCRSLVWMSVFRNWVIADWLKTAEISWKPWRIGTYNKGDTALEDKESLEGVMRRLTTDGAAVLPHTSTLKVEWPGGAASGRSTHGEFVNVLGMEMSKATLGQTETTQSSASSGYAQSKVHNEVRKDLREARSRQVASDLTRDLVTSMILLNFGPDIAIPRFEFITEEAIDLKAFGEALTALTKCGLEIPMKWARDKAGIPEPKKGEPILKPIAPAPFGGGGPENDDGKAPDDKPAEKPNGEPTEAEKPKVEEGKQLREAA